MVCQKRLVSHEVTARAKRTRRDYRSDNNKVVCRQASTSCGRQKRSNYSILLSGAALEQGLSMENADTRQHIARIGHIQSIKFSAMPDKSIEDVCAQHNIQGKHLRLTFRSERRAKKGLSILLGDERVAGMISTNGKSLETQLCVSEVNVRTGMEKCLCSARKLQADIADLEGAFGGLAVERYDVVMEDVQGQDGEPESKMDGVVEVIGNWGRPSGDEQIDCEML